MMSSFRSTMLRVSNATPDQRGVANASAARDQFADALPSAAVARKFTVRRKI
jgi:hypothetical protein